jgi:hypothetical protein
MSTTNEHPSARGASEDPSDSDAANLNHILATSTDDDDDDNDMDYEPAFDDLDSDGDYEDAPEDQAESEVEFDFGPDPGRQLAFLTRLITGQLDEDVDEDMYYSDDEDEEDDEDEDEAGENGESSNPQSTAAIPNRPFLRMFSVPRFSPPLDIFL